MFNLSKENKKNIIIAGIFCLIFLFFGYQAVEYGAYWYAFIPVGVMAIILLFLNFHYSVLAIAFITPFSIFLKYPEISITLPTEPLLLLVMGIFIFELSLRKKTDRALYTNRVSQWILISLVWIAISSLFSTDVIVSFKHLLARLWFVIPCYFMMLYVFKDPKKILAFVALYGFSLSVIIIVTTIKYAATNFDHDFADYIVLPFYNDHTAYGAAIGLFVPIAFYCLFAKKSLYDNIYLRVLFAFICVCLSVGFVLCYARATWLSVFVAVCVLVLVKSRISLRSFTMAVLTFVAVVALSWTTIIDKMSLNSQDSSGNIFEHVQSISNIKTDASNTERLNRWSCAWEMTKERPLVGFGFGTYQFEYGRFQKTKDRTIISTNEGTLGNAHSEYLGPLCETGIFGIVTIVMIFACTIYTGLRAYHRIKDKAEANLALFLTLSLITYYVHGVMNNFLDTDKLAIPFWALTAAVVSLDLYSKKSDKKKEQKDLINNKIE